MTALSAGLTVQGAASAAAAPSHVESFFISERPSLVEGSVAVKLRASVTCAVFVGDMIPVTIAYARCAAFTNAT
jgi:hypothetical protein